MFTLYEELWKPMANVMVWNVGNCGYGDQFSATVMGN